MDMEASNSDLQNIEKLFRENYKSLCNVVNRIVHDWDAAEDVVQEMFIKIWKKRNELKIETTLKGYLYKAASNAALNYLENNKRFKLHQEITEKNTANQIIDESVKLEQKEFEERIDRALDKLPPKCKAIFVLSRFEGMKYQEIANHLDVSLKTVENQMGIALQKLRDDLKPYISGEFMLWPLLLLALSYLLMNI
ncbi:MAG: RNA polymerase sigma-70 factor [Cytophagaceae bacterium]|nr:RNA polymerase sigma-70 factor [Cytophagaceae bacterium]